MNHDTRTLFTAYDRLAREIAHGRCYYYAGRGESFEHRVLVAMSLRSQIIAQTGRDPLPSHRLY